MRVEKQVEEVRCGTEYRLDCVSRGVGGSEASGEHLEVLSGQNLQFTVDSDKGG